MFVEGEFERMFMEYFVPVKYEHFTGTKYIVFHCLFEDQSLALGKLKFLNLLYYFLNNSLLLCNYQPCTICSLQTDAGTRVRDAIDVITVMTHLVFHTQLQLST